MLPYTSVQGHLGDLNQTFPDSSRWLRSNGPSLCLLMGYGCKKISLEDQILEVCKGEWHLPLKESENGP